MLESLRVAIYGSTSRCSRQVTVYNGFARDQQGPWQWLAATRSDGRAERRDADVKCARSSLDAPGGRAHARRERQP